MAQKNDVSYDDLPHDLMKSILMKLMSPRDLVVCMSVCKSWRAIVRHPSFAYMHLQRSRQAAASITDRKAGLVIGAADGIRGLNQCMRYFKRFNRSPAVRLGGRDVYYEVVTSCDGLVLLSTGYFRPRMVLWNPAIRKIKRVPDLRKKDLVGCSSDILSGSVWLPYVFLGMGCIASDNKYDYKIVRISGIESRESSFRRSSGYAKQNVYVGVYSLSSNSWKRIRVVPPIAEPIGFIRYVGCSVSVNDSVHWPVVSAGGSKVILGFDLREEVFWEVPTPAPVNGHDPDNMSWFLAVFEGLLGVVMHHMNEAGLQLVDIWVMKEHRVADSWSKRSVVGPTGFLRTVGTMKNGKVVKECRFDEVVACHPSNNKRKPEAMGGSVGTLTTYLESLALLDGGRTYKKHRVTRGL